MTGPRTAGEEGEVVVVTAADVDAFQRSGRAHPLTCRVCRGEGDCPRRDVGRLAGDHHVLQAVADGQAVRLACPCCPYEQTLDAHTARFIAATLAVDADLGEEQPGRCTATHPHDTAVRCTQPQQPHVSHRDGLRSWTENHRCTMCPLCPACGDRGGLRVELGLPPVTACPACGR